MTGVIEGGWGFVWAAYGLSATIFVVYTWSVISRYRRERSRKSREL